MNFLKMGKILCIALALMLPLCGCGAADTSVPAEPAGVQDINPGDQSIIQPPANQTKQPPKLEERNL